MAVTNQILEKIEYTDTFKQWADKCNKIVTGLNEVTIANDTSFVSLINDDSVIGSKVWNGSTLFNNTVTTFSNVEFKGNQFSTNIDSGYVNIGNSLTTTVKFTKPRIFYKANTTADELLFQFTASDNDQLEIINDTGDLANLFVDGAIKGRNVTLSSSGDIDFTGDFTGPNITISENGNITTNGSISHTNANTFLLTATGDLTLGGDVYAPAGAFTVAGGSITSSGDLSVDGSFTSQGGSITSSGDLSVNGSFTSQGGSITSDGNLSVDGSFTSQGGSITSSGDLNLSGNRINLNGNDAVIKLNGVDWVFPLAAPTTSSLLKWDLASSDLIWSSENDIASSVEANVISSISNLSLALPIQLIPVGTVIDIDKDILQDWFDNFSSGGIFGENASYPGWSVMDGSTVSFDQGTGDIDYEILCKLLDPALVGQTSGSATLPNIVDGGNFANWLSGANDYPSILIKAKEDQLTVFNVATPGGTFGDSGISLYDLGGSPQASLTLEGGRIGLNILADDFVFDGSGKLKLKTRPSHGLNATAETIVLRDAIGNIFAEDPTVPTHVANKQYVDDADGVLLTTINGIETSLNTTLTTFQGTINTQITTLETNVNTQITTLETDVNADLAQTLADVQAENAILQAEIDKVKIDKGFVKTMSDWGDNNGGVFKKLGFSYGALYNYSSANGENLALITKDGEAMAWGRGIGPLDEGTNFSGAKPRAISPITKKFAKIKRIFNSQNLGVIMIDEDDIIYSNTNKNGIQGKAGRLNTSIKEWYAPGQNIYRNNDSINNYWLPSFLPNKSPEFNNGNPVNYIKVDKFYRSELGTDFPNNWMMVKTKDGYDLDGEKYFTGNNEDDGINKPKIRGMVIAPLGGADGKVSNFSNRNTTPADGPLHAGPYTGSTTGFYQRKGTMWHSLWAEYGNTNWQAGVVNQQLSLSDRPEFKSFNFYTPEHEDWDNLVLRNNTQKPSDYQWYIKDLQVNRNSCFIICGKADDPNGFENETWYWGHGDNGISTRTEGDKSCSFPRPVLGDWEYVNGSGANSEGIIMAHPNSGNDNFRRTFQMVDAWNGNVIPHGFQDYDELLADNANSDDITVILGDARGRNRDTCFRFAQDDGGGLWRLARARWDNDFYSDGNNLADWPTSSSIRWQVRRRVKGIVRMVKNENYQDGYQSGGTVFAYKRRFNDVNNKIEERLIVWGQNNRRQASIGNTAAGNADIIIPRNVMNAGGWYNTANFQQFGAEGTKWFVLPTGFAGSWLYNPTALELRYAGMEDAFPRQRITSSNAQLNSQMPEFKHLTQNNFGSNVWKVFDIGPGHLNFGYGTFIVVKEVDDTEGQLWATGQFDDGTLGCPGNGSNTSWTKIQFPEDPMNIVEMVNWGDSDNKSYVNALCKDGGDNSLDEGRIYRCGDTDNNRGEMQQIKPWTNEMSVWFERIDNRILFNPKL